MVASRRNLCSPILGLALLMALPWPLALSTIEVPASTSSRLTSSRIVEATRRLQLFGRTSDELPIGPPTLTLVIGEAEEGGEGDGTGPFAFDLASSPIHGFAVPTESGVFPPSISSERSSCPLTQRLCLRC